MNDDPIVDEIHRIREKLLTQYGGDLTALINDVQKRAEAAATAGANVVILEPRSAVQPGIRKVG